MSELMAQFEEFSRLDKEMDVQVGLIEKLCDRVAYLESRVLELERTRAVKRSKINMDTPVLPPLEPSD